MKIAAVFINYSSYLLNYFINRASNFSSILANSSLSLNKLLMFSLINSLIGVFLIRRKFVHLLNIMYLSKKDDFLIFIIPYIIFIKQ